MSADYQVHNDVAVITFNNPPVNGLGLATRTAAVDALLRAQADPAVRAIVLAGAGKVFSGGADIREFNRPQALTEPTLHTLIATAEGASKPVVAAVHGVCMGGGLELALGCHYRVALPGTRVALPEVKLGLLPGAGGTQRLPRVLGLERALDMIVAGNPVLSDQLAGSPLFDELLAPGSDVVAGAVAFARRMAGVRPLPKVRDRAVDHPDAQAFLAQARAKVAAAAGPYPAPAACVDALAAAVGLPFEAGLAFERDSFLALARTTESKALRHAFFAERAAGKVAGLDARAAPRVVRAAGVVGAGTMGAGIALCFLDAGIPVTLLDARQDALDAGLARIRAAYDGSVARRRVAREEADRRLGLLRTTLAAGDVKDADLIVEAVVEDLAAKEAVFRQLDGIARPGAILATNTSTLDVDRIAAATSRPRDVLGLHFFSPANVVKLLEIVRGRETADDVLATALALAKTLGKTGVVARAGDGFIGGRMVGAYLRQAGYLLDEGALPEQVDHAIEAFGFAMGPFRMSDLAGNDIGWAIRRQRRAAHPGQAERAIGDEEIVERLVYALVNEGARILEEGIAQRASDIDMVCLSGYGFPLYRGGPMFYADTVGLPRVLAAIGRFAQGPHGDAWTPAPLLVRLAGEDKGFND